MSGYFDSEASVSDGEDEPEVKRPKRYNDSISSEDSEDDNFPNEDEILRKEGQGFIVDDEDVGDDESENESGVSDNSAKDDVAEDGDLDDDDYQLIHENVGINLRRTTKRRLIINDEDDADVGTTRASKEARSREAIARQIFEDDDDDENARRREPLRQAPTFEAKSDDDENEDSDDMGDFIVDTVNEDRGGKRKRQFVHSDPSLQEAQEIFGVDFDFDEFDQQRDQESDDSGESEYLDEDSEETMVRRRQKREANVASHDVLYDIFDPSDLERKFYRPEDERIRRLDVPERMQLRKLPVKRIDPKSETYNEDLLEIEAEAEWIFNNAFKIHEGKFTSSATDSIFEVLKIMKTSLAEVPFIAFYRKEHFAKLFNINDLWLIYEFDEKWEELQKDRKILINTMSKMHKYLESKSKEPESEIKPGCDGLIRLIALAKSASSMDEIQDVRMDYLLHYAIHKYDMEIWEGKDVSLQRKKTDKEEESSKGNQDEDDDPDDEDYVPEEGLKKVSLQDQEETEKPSDEAQSIVKKRPTMGALTTTVDPLTGRRIRQRQVRTTAAYEVAQRAGISRLVEKFGLSSEQFADNVRDQYRRHEVTTCPIMPHEAAQDYICPQFPKSESVLRAARYILAYQIAAEPIVRRWARQSLENQIVIDVKPTAKGMRIIDENHPLASVKFLKNKPAQELMSNAIFIQIHSASREGLITYNIHALEYQQKGISLLDNLVSFFHQDEFSALAQAWNEQRSLMLKEAIENFLQPAIIKEIQRKLLESSQKTVISICSNTLFERLRIAPYVVDDLRGGGGMGDDEEDGGQHYHGEGSSNGNSVWPKPARLLAFALSDDSETSRTMVTVVKLDADGEVVDFLNLPGLLISPKSQGPEHRRWHQEDVKKLDKFISKSDPQAIVIGCNSRRSLDLRDVVQRQIEEIVGDGRISRRPNIVLMDTELAQVYARSEGATSSLPSSYTLLLKQAISLGRRLQDPLAEFAQLFNAPDMDILGLRWHSAQDEVPRDKLLRALEHEFVNRTNEVGVDLNRCILHSHTANLLQFVSGLGPRKAAYIIKLLKHDKMFLTNRELLARSLGLGPNVAVNCAGFIKIDTLALRELSSNDTNVEILDCTRVHPESYDLARQMAVDALEYDDNDDNDPTLALEEIMQDPSRLRELDLDAFADELARQDHGDKHITLYDIRKELNQRYRDYRDPFEPPTPEQIFSMITHETPETMHKGSLVECQVIGLASRKPTQEQIDNANPIKNNDTGLWTCPFCRKEGFAQFGDMWPHYDNDCLGQVSGIRVQLDNGITGFVPCRFIDRPLEATFEKILPGSVLRGKILKIDINKFNVEISIRSSDLQDRPMTIQRRDPFYDYNEEEVELKKQAEEEERAKSRASNAYLNRVNFHPFFKNITYHQLMQMNPILAVGSVTIRPSRKSNDHLTISLKVDDGIFMHIDVTEVGKPKDFLTGEKFIINNMTFDDLDEVCALFMDPMITLIQEIYAYKYYVDSKGGLKDIIEAKLKEEKSAAKSKIPYCLSSLKKYPGSFYLAYMPHQTVHYEIFSVKYNGLKLRKIVFPGLESMIGWFKVHYRELQPSRHDYHRSSGVTNHSSRTIPDVGNSATTITGRTPKMEDFFNMPVPHGKSRLKPL
nr:transcription elongation factor spt6 [Hymenolepis microstoma]